MHSRRLHLGVKTSFVSRKIAIFVSVAYFHYCVYVIVSYFNYTLFSISGSNLYSLFICYSLLEYSQWNDLSEYLFQTVVYILSIVILSEILKIIETPNWSKFKYASIGSCDVIRVLVYK